MSTDNISELKKEIDKLKSRIIELEKHELENKGELSALIEDRKLFIQFMLHLPGYAYLKDANRKIIFVNEKLAQDFNLPAEQWLGKRNEDIWPGEFGNSIKEMDEKILSTMQVAYYEEKSNIDGKIQTYFTTKFPIVLDDGRKYLGGISIDISQSKLNEEELKAAKEKYSILLDESTDPIFSFERDGTYKYVNNAFAAPFKKKPDEIIGKLIWDIFPKEEAEKRFSVVKRVFETGELVVFEVRVPVPAGDRYYITSVKPIFDADKNVITVICISKEITDRKKIEHELSAQNLELKSVAEKLESANASKDKFISILAHDLRSPFFAILGLSEILTSECDEMTHSDIKSQLGNLSSTMKNLYQLVDELLTWSTLQTGKALFKPVSINLKEEATDVINQLLPLAIPKNILLNNLIVENLVVRADKQMIRLLLRNLISNAIKFTRYQGQVDVKGFMKDKLVEIVVHDNGIGINSELLKKLFDISANITKEGTGGEVGTGLGLLLCKEILEQHKGNIWVESEVNKGSKFYFNLPL